MNTLLPPPPPNFEKPMDLKLSPDFRIAIVGAGYVRPSITCSTLRAYLGSKLRGACCRYRPEEKMGAKQLCGEIARIRAVRRLEWDSIAQIFECGADIGGTWRVSLFPLSDSFRVFHYPFPRSVVYTLT